MLRFGTAGIPSSTKPKTTENGIRRCKELGLGAMELEFVHRVNIPEARTQRIREAAEESGIKLSCHAPYYINLNAREKPKISASMERIFESARIASLCGGWSVAFHPGFYLQMDKEEVYQRIKRSLILVSERLRESGIDILLAPETTGKFSQFGNLDEVIRLSQDVEMVHPCIDFGHMHARGGGCNSYDEISGILERIENDLGREELKRMHIQFTGIEYGPSGEKRHIPLEDSDYNYPALAKALKDYKIGGSAICESPNSEGDAVLMKELCS